MRTLYICLLLLPLRLPAQPDSLPCPINQRPAGPLKPIEFREIPYTYTTHSSSTYRGHTTYLSSTHTGIKRIYTYDGIDVDNPERELWPRMDALNDEDVQYEHLQYDDIVARRQTANSIGAALILPGLVMLVVGAVQAGEYKAELSKQQTAYTKQQSTYTAPATPTPTGPTINNCSTWIGSGNKWTCWSGPYSGTTINYDPFGPVIPAPVSTPTTYPIKTTLPTTLHQPDGKGLVIGGSIAILVGTIIGASARGDAGATFLKAVQYYNRALKQKFSWEMQPWSGYGATGFRLVGHF